MKYKAFPLNLWKSQECVHKKSGIPSVSCCNFILREETKALDIHIVFTSDILIIEWSKNLFKQRLVLQNFEKYFSYYRLTSRSLTKLFLSSFFSADFLRRYKDFRSTKISKDFSKVASKNKMNKAFQVPKVSKKGLRLTIFLQTKIPFFYFKKVSFDLLYFFSFQRKNFYYFSYNCLSKRCSF